MNKTDKSHENTGCDRSLKALLSDKQILLSAMKEMYI